ncbi:MAG TPA: VOC family protein [Ilumatobacteraceae bacterium]|nr:VOC family protein [Ilumatobacteraceae bacterium]
MTESTNQLPFPNHGVIAHLICQNANEAIDFYVKAFDGVEQMRLAAPDGSLMHGCVTINGGPIFLTEEKPDFGARGPKLLGGSGVSLHLNVADVDAAFAKAVAAGCQAAMEPADQFWGDRYGVVIDPYGHMWAIASPLPNQPDLSDLAELARKAVEEHG